MKYLYRENTFNTPIDRIRYMLYKFTQDISFIYEVDEDVAISRANKLMEIFDKRGMNEISLFQIELKKHMDDYIEDLLLNRSV